MMTNNDLNNSKFELDVSCTATLVNACCSAEMTTPHPQFLATMTRPIFLYSRKTFKGEYNLSPYANIPAAIFFIFSS